MKKQILFLFIFLLSFILIGCGLVKEKPTYLVMFDGNGGTLVSGVQTQSVSSNSEIVMPTYEREGYTFDNWYIDAELTTPYNQEIVLKNNLYLYAKWIAKQYIITFNSNEGSPVNTITQDYNTVVTEPTSPTKLGYTFNGWYSDSELTTIYTFTTMLAEDMTLYAKWIINQYTITFDSNEGSLVTAITQDYNTVVTAPTTPTKEGYTFDGWYSDSSFTNIYTFTTMPAHDLVLYGNWLSTISFNSNGGSTVESITRPFYSLVIAPTNPIKENYTFVGWYSDESLTISYGFTTMPNQNITLYAKWQNTITFESNGGSEVNPITQDINSDVEAPREPTKEGYTFAGWFTDSSFTTPFVFDKMPLNITLYAKWTIDQYTIMYSINNAPLNCIPLIPGETIIQVSLGESHSSALTSTGRIFMWGRNNSGQLGDGTTTDSLVPTEITSSFNLASNETIIQISLGTIHSSALTSTGRIFMWGRNNSGQLGDGTTTDRLVPTEITNNFNLTTNEKIIQVSLGGYHSSALTSTGRIFMWGSNDYGQLGDGTRTHRSVPTEITNHFSLTSNDKIIQVSLGYLHSSALTSTGRIFMWGSNDYGQLGDGTRTERSVPTEITSRFGLPADDKIIQVSLGVYYSSTLTLTGRIFIWGYNGYGQLGVGPNIDKLVPTEITSSFNLTTDEEIIQVSLGWDHSSALTSSGRVFMWGLSSYGELGDGTTTDRIVPTEIKSRFSLATDEKIIQVSLGTEYSSAITSTGRIFMWGWNSFGQLGDGTTTNRLVPTELHTQTISIYETITFDYNQPTTNLLPELSGYTFSGWYTDTKFTEPYTFTTMPAHDLVLYGNWLSTISFNSNGGSTVESITRPFYSLVIAPTNPIKENYTFVGWYSDESLTISYGFTTMPNQNITLYAKWQNTITFESNGGSEVNPITQDINSDVEAPREPTKEGYTFAGWFTDSSFTTPFVFDKMPLNITLYAKWTIDQYTIMYSINNAPLNCIPLIPGETIIQVSLGESHSSALTSTGRIFMWGRNNSGQLGDGTTTDSLVPTEITSSFSLASDDKIIQVSFGYYHSSALTSTGRIFIWGNNFYGQLGDGTRTHRSVPTEITSSFNLTTDEKIIQVSLGSNHSSTLTNKGRIFTWGYNYYGQLGDGMTTDKSEPVEITSRFSLSSGETITQISLGGGHSLALTSTGRVFTWGDNEYGQLGDGTTTDKTQPVEITSRFGLSSGEAIVQISLGYDHSSVLTSIGHIFTWGYNGYGQLGVGPNIDKLVPTEITSSFNLASDEKIIQVSLGQFHSSALTSTGRIFTWGNNMYGQLGNGTITRRSVPTEITSGFDLATDGTIVQVSLGWYHSSALTSTGRIFMWGRNYYGELGNSSTTIDRLVPTELDTQTISIYKIIIFDYNQPTTNLLPELSGYTFSGWYTDMRLTKPYTFTTMPAHDLILYGKWIPN